MDLGKFISALCDVGQREELYRCYGKSFITSLAPTLAMADAWAKEKSASAATGAEIRQNI